MGNSQDSLQDIEVDNLEKQLIRAAKYGDEQLLEELLENDEVSNDESKDILQVPLLMAAKEGYPECVELILKAGAFVNGGEESSPSWTPIWVATYEGHKKCVQVLLDWGAEVNVKSPETPLFVAVRENELACLKMLIKAGADVNVLDKDGRSPLCIASKEGCQEVANILISADCELEIADNHGNTALLLACIYSDYRLLEILLRAGADHSRRTTMPTMPGYTAMHICASKSKTKSLEVLWRFGADVHALSEDGMQPRDLAVFSGCEECLLQLERTVRSLKSICRLKIRSLYKVHELNHLDVPNDVKAFLKW